MCVAVGAGNTERAGETAFAKEFWAYQDNVRGYRATTNRLLRAAQYSQFGRQADTGYSEHVGGHARCGELHVHSAVTMPPHGAMITDVGAKLRQSQVHDENNGACGHVCEYMGVTPPASRVPRLTVKSCALGPAQMRTHMYAHADAHVRTCTHMRMHVSKSGRCRPHTRATRAATNGDQSILDSMYPGCGGHEFDSGVVVCKYIMLKTIYLRRFMSGHRSLPPGPEVEGTLRCHACVGQVVGKFGDAAHGRPAAALVDLCRPITFLWLRQAQRGIYLCSQLCTIFDANERCDASQAAERSLVKRRLCARKTNSSRNQRSADTEGLRRLVGISCAS